MQQTFLRLLARVAPGVPLAALEFDDADILPALERDVVAPRENAGAGAQ